MKVLLFTDAHVSPGESLSRFRKLGNFIVEERPDAIIQLGDFSTMDSLSHWDRNKRLKLENQRYNGDIEATNSAILKIISPIYSLNEKLRISKKTLYKPDIYWCYGNHEAWVAQYVEMNPELHNFLDLNKNIDYTLMKENSRNFVIVPYPEIFWLGGVAFTHMARNKGGPIRSRYAVSRALEHFDTSVFFGHTHRKTEDSIARYSNKGNIKVLRAINCGCFYEEVPEYAEHNPSDYWAGVILIELYGSGEFDYKTVGLEML